MTVKGTIAERIFAFNAGRRPEQYGHDLYANLRTLDKAGCQRILVQDVPEGERWEAIRDRLSALARMQSRRLLQCGLLPIR